MHTDNAVRAVNRETLRHKPICREEEKITEELPSTAHTALSILLAMWKNPVNLVVNSM
jgi:hypothetical protein